MKTYGVYLAYPPLVDLRSEGLGRYLALFLREAATRTDVKFVIACPSWMNKSLVQLFDEFSIPKTAFEIIGPKKIPQLLRLYQAYLSYQQRQRRVGRFTILKNALLGVVRVAVRSFERQLVTTRSTPLFVGLVALILLTSPFVATAFAFKGVYKLVRGLIGRRYRSFLALYSSAALNALRRPQSSATTVRLFQYLEKMESDLLIEIINNRKDVSAWYAPTAFWPEFNRIAVPHVICVPDVVLSEFPVSFASAGGDRGLQAFEKVTRTISGSNCLITYSRDVKYRTLVERYHIDPESVSVIPHGANRLDDLITISGFSNADTATDAFCRNVLRGALGKSIGPSLRSDSVDFSFIFYASQFRPNKNIISLLRAHDNLLKRRYVGHKLILTGDPKSLPEVDEFIKKAGLQNDVIFLRGLTTQELAACYWLADLAVNPSLSEGGCPFTLTEALSVRTPVVMARIAVTEEVVTDPELQKMMLFDPYRWEDIADRMHWALQNGDLLLKAQTNLFERIAMRSWKDVVNDHVGILDCISGGKRVDEHPT